MHGTVDEKLFQNNSFINYMQLRTFLCEKSGPIALVLPSLMVGRLTGSPADEIVLNLELLKLYAR